MSSPAGPDFLSEEEWRLVARSLNLTKREAEILSCMFRDAREAQIAVALGLSRHTVHSYLDRLYRKLRVNSKFQLLRRVFSAYVSVSREGLRPAPVESTAPKKTS